MSIIHLLHPKYYVDKRTQRKRFLICLNCPSKIYNKGWCPKSRGGCGCLTTLKTELKTEECPKGHWLKEEINEI